MADQKTYGQCGCGCGEDITHEGSSYAGTDEATRNRHRARAAYRRRSGQATLPGTRESLAELGLADDVPLDHLAATVASAVTELARRVTGLDSAAIAREIERGVQSARQQAEAAEQRAARSEASASKAADDLAAAVARADQADEDAARAGERAATAETAITALQTQIGELNKQLREAAEQRADAERQADRANTILAELRTSHVTAITETTSRLAAEKATALAELRAELTTTIGDLKAELATAKAEAAANRSRAERAESANKAPRPSGRISRAKTE
jgi:chromosome segregation ATPase